MAKAKRRRGGDNGEGKLKRKASDRKKRKRRDTDRGQIKGENNEVIIILLRTRVLYNTRISVTYITILEGGVIYTVLVRYSKRCGIKPVILQNFLINVVAARFILDNMQFDTK